MSKEIFDWLDHALTLYEICRAVYEWWKSRK
jgi:hypothetical protein